MKLDMMKLLVEMTMSQKEININFVKWVIENEGLSISSFYRKQDRVEFVQVLARSWIKHISLSKWNDFGTNFQDLIIQVWNNLSQGEAQDFCKGIISQVEDPFREKVYNCILECFHFYVLPRYSLSFANFLLDEMVEIGITPSSLAYENVIAFNAICANSLPQNPQNLQILKTLYFRHRSHISNFGLGALSSMLVGFTASSKRSLMDNVSVLEISKRLFKNGGNQSRRFCESVLDAAEQIIIVLHPELQANVSTCNMVESRIRFIANNGTCIKETSASDLFALLSSCYRILVCSSEEESTSLIVTLLESLMTPSAVLEFSFLESIFSFYFKSGFKFDFEAVIEVLETAGVTSTDKILYLMLCYKMINARLPPEILSLMIISSAKNRDLRAMKNYWGRCLDSDQPISTSCYFNAIEGYLCYTNSLLGNFSVSDSYEFLIGIKEALRTKPPIYLRDVYSKFVYAHSKYCIEFQDARLEEFLDTLAKCVFGYRRGHFPSSYKYTIIAFRAFMERDPSHGPILLRETEKLIVFMLKYYIKSPCATYYQLLNLLHTLGDEFLFQQVFEMFRFMLAKDHVSDPSCSDEVLALENRLSFKK